mgnify:FL=1
MRLNMLRGKLDSNRKSSNVKQKTPACSQVYFDCLRSIFFTFFCDSVFYGFRKYNLCARDGGEHSGSAGGRQNINNTRDERSNDAADVCSADTGKY